MMDWPSYFHGIARAVSLKSKDPSTRVGCVIVGPAREIRSTGWNGLPRGVIDLPERMERPAKYDWTIHAEANAIANAARAGIALNGCTVYVTHMPCRHCAGLLVQAGIRCVSVGNGALVGDHGADIALMQFEEAGITIMQEGRNGV